MATCPNQFQPYTILNFQCASVLSTAFGSVHHMASPRFLSFSARLPPSASVSHPLLNEPIPLSHASSCPFDGLDLDNPPDEDDGPIRNHSEGDDGDPDSDGDDDPDPSGDGNPFDDDPLNNDLDDQVNNIPLSYESLAQLTLTIEQLFHVIERQLDNCESRSTRTKVHEPDFFDGFNLKTLWTFLFYLKGVVLEYFEPDILDYKILEQHPLWMDDYQEFMYELQINFGPHNPIADAESQLKHLHIYEGQKIIKYIVEWNCLAIQARDWGEGALRQSFYNGLLD
ncbi:hypothetical protein F5I97DRAFT_1929705 [Phlebopus sp. FC_14]|nr:hypothetical protein F5I97DRAFT_1929705 [Phlebopus sp. FC_14]